MKASLIKRAVLSACAEWLEMVRSLVHDLRKAEQDRLEKKICR